MEHQNSDDQGNHSSATPQVSLGAMLREARERLNFSVADVAVQIKFSPRQIEALEADDFKNLPETAFLRGFVRSYAKILNLDAQAVLDALPQATKPAAELKPASVDVPFPVDDSSQKNLILLGAALLLAVIVVGFAVWHFTAPPKEASVAKIETPVSLPAETQSIPEPPVLSPSVDTEAISAKAEKRSADAEKKPPVHTRQEKVEKTTRVTDSAPAEAKPRSSVKVEKSSVKAAKPAADQTVPQTQPTESAPDLTVPQTQPTESAADLTVPQTQSTESPGDGTTMPTTLLRLVFDEESWAEVKDKDGNILSSRIHPADSEMSLHGHAPLSVVVGHAASVHLFKNGEPIDLAPYTNASSEVARLTLE